MKMQERFKCGKCGGQNIEFSIIETSDTRFKIIEGDYNAVYESTPLRVDSVIVKNDENGLVCLGCGARCSAWKMSREDSQKVENWKFQNSDVLMV